MEDKLKSYGIGIGIILIFSMAINTSGKCSNGDEYNTNVLMYSIANLTDTLCKP